MKLQDLLKEELGEARTYRRRYPKSSSRRSYRRTYPSTYYGYSSGRRYSFKPYYSPTSGLSMTGLEPDRRTRGGTSTPKVDSSDFEGGFQGYYHTPKPPKPSSDRTDWGGFYRTTKTPFGDIPLSLAHMLRNKEYPKKYFSGLINLGRLAMKGLFYPNTSREADDALATLADTFQTTEEHLRAIGPEGIRDLVKGAVKR